MTRRSSFLRAEAQLHAHGCRPKTRGDHIDAHCPAHEDHDPSLSIDWKPAEGMLLVCCHAGCDVGRVMDELGLGLSGLHDDPAPKVVPDHRHRFNPEAIHNYTDQHGEILGRVHRKRCDCGKKAIHWDRPDGRGGWETQSPTVKPLYNLPNLLRGLRSGAPIFVVEGESSVDALTQLGQVATTNPGGSGPGKWRPIDTDTLRIAKRVTIIADNDGEGYKHAARICAELQRVGVSVSVKRAAVRTKGADIVDHLAAGHTLLDLVDVPDGLLGDTPADSVGLVDQIRPWEPPIPITASIMPPFPVERLSGLRTIVTQVAESYQAPADLAALSALSTVAAALGGRRAVRVKSTWTEALVLYACALLNSGERKSPVLDFFKEPLVSAQVQLLADAAPKLSADQQERRILAERMKSLESDAAKLKDAGARTDARKEAAQVRADLDALGEEPFPPQLTTADVTPEGLLRMMAEQYGRAAILVSEAGILGSLAGRYAKIPNLDLVLEAYRGAPYQMRRAGTGAVDLPSVNLTLCLCVQPGMMAGLASERENQFRASGLLARFMCAIPAPMVGRRSIDSPDIDGKVAADYHQRVENLALNIWDTDTTLHIGLDEGAAKLLREYRIHIEPRLGPEGDLFDLGDWGAKLVGNLVRIAGLITLYDKADAAEIPEARMRDALAMSDYFIAHAQRTFALMGGDSDVRLENPRRVLEYLRKQAAAAVADGRDPDESFTLRDVHYGMKRQAWVEEGGAEAVKQAVTDLAEYGWVRREIRATRGRGRPSERFEPHPWISSPPNRATKTTELRDIAQAEHWGGSGRAETHGDGHGNTGGAGTETTKTRTRSAPVPAQQRAPRSQAVRESNGVAEASTAWGTGAPSSVDIVGTGDAADPHSPSMADRSATWGNARNAAEFRAGSDSVGFVDPNAAWFSGESAGDDGDLETF